MKDITGHAGIEERKYPTMKKLIALLLAMMTVMALMIPVFASAEEPAANTTMWVNPADGKKLNVRTEPNRTTSRLMYRLVPGTKVTIDYSVAAPEGWAFVTTAGHKNGGFVMTKFLQANKPGKYEITERDDNFRAVEPYTVEAIARGTKRADSVCLRVKPNKTAQSLRRLMPGDRLEVIEVGATWNKVVDLATGKVGYVANDYIIRL